MELHVYAPNFSKKQKKTNKQTTKKRKREREKNSSSKNQKGFTEIRMTNFLQLTHLWKTHILHSSHCTDTIWASKQSSASNKTVMKWNYKMSHLFIQHTMSLCQFKKDRDSVIDRDLLNLATLLSCWKTQDQTFNWLAFKTRKNRATTFATLTFDQGHQNKHACEKHNGGYYHPK